MKLLRCFILCLGLLLLTGCQLQDAYSGKIVFRGQHAIRTGQSLEGDLVIFGGEVLIAPGADVSGNVHLFDGQLSLSGNIQGNVNQFGGTLTLLDGSEITGNLNLGSGQTQGESRARIGGQVIRLQTKDQGAGSIPAQNQSAGRVIAVLLEAVVLVLVAYLSERYFPMHLDRIGQASSRYFLVCVALGVLSWVIGLSLLVLMAYTILLIPVSLLAGGLMCLATALGSVPYARRLGGWASQKISWPVNPGGKTAFGMVLLVMVGEVVRLFPWLGGSVMIFILLGAFGAVLLTRFGFQAFVPELD